MIIVQIILYSPWFLGVFVTGDLVNPPDGDLVDHLHLVTGDLVNPPDGDRVDHLHLVTGDLVTGDLVNPPDGDLVDHLHLVTGDLLKPPGLVKGDLVNPPCSATYERKTSARGTESSTFETEPLSCGTEPLSRGTEPLPRGTEPSDSETEPSTHSWLSQSQDENSAKITELEEELSGVEWEEFDYRGYMQKDLEEGDHAEPNKRFTINIVKSSRLKPNRTVPDHRPSVCAGRQYSDLPSASVIITFYREPRSTLFRTIVSVLNRSPKLLIKEIIVVDDYNEDPSVGSQLAQISKVRVLRNEQRQGLMRSRVAGVEAATGEVVVFLDSHCEVEAGWLEPLLDRIKRNPTTIASPVIDNINFDTFKFEAVSTYLRGGFDWRLDFFWEYITPSDRAHKIRDPGYPVSTPVIAGGLFAVNRAWFVEIGTYDTGMNVWGGEQIELSLRTWMCGGTMEIVPCSKVGHIYKHKAAGTNTEDRSEFLHCNNERAAATWLDNYFPLYNNTIPPAHRNKDCGDISERIKLRKRLKCKDMDWYLRHVYPELQIPGVGDLSFGNIHTHQPSWLLCLDPTSHSGEQSLGASPCMESNHVQQFHHTQNYNIRQDDFCLTLHVGQIGAALKMDLCATDSGLQKWKKVYPGKKVAARTGLKGFLLKNDRFDLCVDGSKITEKGVVGQRCDPENKHQRFMFQYNSP